MIRTSTVILLLILFTACSFGQTETYVGNILRIDMNSDKVDYADTLGTWYFVATNDTVSSRLYYGHMNAGKNEYFIIVESKKFQDKQQTSFYLEDATNMKSKYSLLEISNDDGVALNQYRRYYQLFRTENGVWIAADIYGNNFISNDGIFSNAHITTNTGKNLILHDILGKVGDNYVSSFFDAADSSKYYYFLVNLNNSPNIYVAQENLITFSDSIAPIKIASIKNDLYIVKKDEWYGNLYTYRLSGLQFDFIKVNEINCELKWTINNTRIIDYGYGDHGYEESYVYNFREADTSFVLDTTLSSSMIFDNSLKYGFEMINGSISLYDVVKGEKVNSIYMNEISNYFYYNSFIDSPYIYIYQDLQKIDINDDINESANLTYKLSAYPNPFNPQTTIAFTIPNAGKVELAVYDLLGRRVTELLNEYRDKGSYEVKFNGADLASGIYFYTIRAGSFVKTEKLMLLK